MGDLPSLLVSYAGLRNRREIPLEGAGFATWCLDSGAYSAHNSGLVIKNGEFVEFARQVLAADPRCDMVFALDVIGDPEASFRNALEARAAGIDVVPTWHAGEPLEMAVRIKEEFGRMAIGGLVARLRNNRAQLLTRAQKIDWCSRFFCAVWPAWVHGFGCTTRELLRRFPFASVDSTTWSLSPGMYGSWRSFGRLPVRMRGHQSHWLAAEIAAFMKEQREHGSRWRRELDEVGCSEFKIRLACAPGDIRKHFSGDSGGR